MRRVVYRSAITGRFVSREYALEHPNTTIRQEVEAKNVIEQAADRVVDAMKERTFARKH